MKLSELIDKLDYEKLVNCDNTDIELTGISYNSKLAKNGDLFVCMRGEHTDGHKYFQDAVNSGVKAFLCEDELDCNLPQIIVKSTEQTLAIPSALLYNYPSNDLNLIGVTGTNGKTTVTHLIQRIFEHYNEKCAIIGTLGYKLSSSDNYKEAKHTTPQAPELQAVLHTVKDNGIKNVAMEVSSHSLSQNRVGECVFNGAVLTNLTQDHLDYHITMDNYFEAKALLFERIKENGFAVINADDKYAQKFIKKVPENVKIYTYGIEHINSTLQAKDISFSSNGASFTCVVDGREIKINLAMNGMFSIYNVLAALTVAYANGYDVEKSAECISKLHGVAGRFEVIVKEPLVIVDYAHTPDGLENVLNAAMRIKPHNGKLICLFGCGGDRDATKRPKMGAIAEQIADKVILTSDNPRSENPQQIITDILAGFSSVQNVTVEEDRGEAIRLLKSIAQKDDVVVVAGKGHEDYQILADKTIHFDDREEVRKVFDILVSAK